MQHITIETDFDITNTGVIRAFKKGVLPAKVAGRVIHSKEEWMKNRRQQANWETIIQLISLRTQPLNINTTEKNGVWILEFDVESISVYASVDDQLGLLKADFNRVPLIIGLNETKVLTDYIIVDGEHPNVRLSTYETKR